MRKMNFTQYILSKIHLPHVVFEGLRVIKDRLLYSMLVFSKDIRSFIRCASKLVLKQSLLQYCSNQKFIDTYLAEQEALQRQKEHEDHVQRCTIRIQAWWRGVMVRRKLGPYRPEEKKKKRPVKTKK